MERERIPRIIHYCWFGNNPLPPMAVKCIESWKKYCPEYQIIEWNENNFDVNYNDYVKEAYNAQKWAFVSDVVRLYALVKMGGIYMDTDVELIKPLDELLIYEAVSGFEAETRILTGLMASQAEQGLFKELLNEYNDCHFTKATGEFDLTTNVSRITNACLKYGLILNNTKQLVHGLTLLPCEYLCPKNYETGRISITKNTICIHHFDGSWLTERQKYEATLKNKLERIIPREAAGYIARFWCIFKFEGISKAIHTFTIWLEKKIKK